MKKSLIHSGCLLMLLLVLTGCGGDDVSSTANQETFGEPARFKIADTTWQTSIPLDWSASETKPSGTILVALYQDQNFIIAQKPGFDEGTKARMIENSQTAFFDFTLQSESSTQWAFKGKLGVEDPMRVFHQKILPVPGTDSYLMGLCSYDHWEGRITACPEILDRWIAEEATNN